MHSKVKDLFANLWENYVAITPSAEKIHALLNTFEKSHSSSEAPIINDHIALRTFNIDKISLDKLAQHFLALGYTEQGQYEFKQKKLVAKHFEHPDDTLPKVFISELLVEEMPEHIQHIIYSLVDSVANNAADKPEFLYSGAHWQISAADYASLVAESEYAAWMSVWGFRANHFTVSVNHLSHFTELAALNAKLIEAGFVLNQSGGEIKGGPEVLLAQSSTMADKITVKLSDAELSVPSCFYEFAQRYPMDNGKLYQGFVAASADKIFESTNATTTM
ncbi:DUF1338 domain-containing protein [Paraglaciecola sp.]|uniref:DUF1338 domain-containing protein n=1 Tax=Paraglaciecola sp. TaxID=1920173 RepID=UPI00273D1F88|nr:DUF1338 domain-containing protein [Paraglaciecola sp.]MDP5030631.1 DUF1338 domain-containing protein [Paraglaciecola sp.]